MALKPPPPSHDTRRDYLMVRCTPAQRVAWKTRAAKLNMSLSEWVRQSLEDTIYVRPKR